MHTTSSIAVVVGLLLTATLAGISVPVAAQAPAPSGTPVPGTAAGAQAPGLPDPATLPGRPGMPGPGAGAGGTPGTTPPPRDPSARPPAVKGTAVVAGRVLAGDTGLPLRRARVVLRGTGGTGHMTQTDGDGTFAFHDLPAGRYNLMGSKPRYVDTHLGARRPGRSGRPFELADGQTIGNVALALAPAGVITGRVVDETGDVVPGVTVMPLRYRTVNGERQLMPTGAPRQSDDTGTFRLHGLAPGSYYVSARAEDIGRYSGMMAEMIDPNIAGFAPTFYPGTTVASDAQPIEVVAGAEVVADLPLVPTRLTTVSGVVVDASGRPATGGHLMSMGAGAGSMSYGGNGTGIKPDGSFSLAGVAPGEYILQARPMFGSPTFEEEAPRNTQRVASARVVVSGTPISDLRLVVVDPIRIPVNAIYEDASAQKPDRVFVSAQSPHRMGGGTAAVRDGHFSLEIVPGSYTLSASANPPWYTKRIVYRGRELVGSDDVELTAEPGGRIDVIFSTQSATVTGGVTDSTGKAVMDYTVVLFPDDVELARRAGYQRVRTARPDQQGRFRTERFPPGSYLAAAMADIETDDVFDPEFLETLRRDAKPFRVGEGESLDLTLKLLALP